jgi:NTE family protein
MAAKRIIIPILLIMIHTTINSQPTVGVVLSGGGALGFAHIGCLQSLEEAGIYPDYVAGASMGALVGAFYANGMAPTEIYTMAQKEKIYKKTKLFYPSVDRVNLGLSSHKNVEKLMNKYIGHNSFDSLQKHLYVSVTNLNTQECEFIGSGNMLKEYVLASSSIPAVFESVIIDGQFYVDGGTTNNMPAQAIRDKCDILIGIDVVPPSKLDTINDFIGLSIRTMNTMTISNSKEGRVMCDYVIDCMAIEKYNNFNFEKYKEIYEIGYETMKKYIEEHPGMMEAVYND